MRQQRAWTMPTWTAPKSPVSREQVDNFGQAAAKGVTAFARAVAKAVAGLARLVARVVTQIWRALDAVPAAVRLISGMAVLMLLGVVGSLTAAGPLAVLCSVVVVPVCAVALGALGNRWFTGKPAQQEAAESELNRSVVYVDKKLTLALNSLGSERHQQAVIALFQAKTAVELALGTEQDDDTPAEAPVQVDAYRMRPRIQAGATAKSALSESNSLAAS